MPFIAERCRDQRAISWLHDFRRDVIYGLRMLLRNPIASCVIVASLALGIGANTAVLGAIDAITRTRLLIPEPERVVVIRTYRQETPAEDSSATVAHYLAWVEQNQSFESFGLTLGNQANFDDGEGAPAERSHNRREGQRETARARSAGVARRALVTILDEQPAIHASETALLSEAALAEDWNRPEEDAAWAHLQKVQ